ncbi:MAG: type II toxin-antitoxin system HigB family toxin [Terracidiphilus sp.]
MNGFADCRVEKRLRKTVKEQLDSWYAVASRAEWKNSAELKQQFSSASIVSSERVVFNIKGNDYRLVTAIDYAHSVMLVLWLGTHREYDEIDVTRVRHEKERYADSTHSN